MVNGKFLRCCSSFQLQNNLKAINHLRVDDVITKAKIFVSLDRDAAYELYKVVGKIDIDVGPGRLFTLRCELIRCAQFRKEQVSIHSGIVELVAAFDVYSTKRIDLVSLLTDLSDFMRSLLSNEDYLYLRLTIKFFF